MILDVKKNIFFGILLSLITFLFIFIPGFKIKAAELNNVTCLNDDQIISSNNYHTLTCKDVKNVYKLSIDTFDELSEDSFDNIYVFLDPSVPNFPQLFANKDESKFSFSDKYFYFSGTTYRVQLDVPNSQYYHFSDTHASDFYNYSSSYGIYKVNIDNYFKTQTYTFNYQYDKKRGPLDKLYSIDYIFDSNTFTSDTAIQYEINYIDEYEKYSDENISSYLYLDSFKFYGFVNNDGLYHWEELDNTSNSYVDDYEDYYQDGKYYFNVKKMNLDFTNYEKIIFRSIFFNDNYLESAVTRSNNEKISRDDVFYNTVFGPTYLNMQFDTKELFYLNITSTLLEYKSRWYTWDYSDSDPYKQPYLNYFDLTTSQFVSESHGLPLYYANDLNYDFIEKHDVVIGTSTNKGVVITEEFKKRSVGGLVFTYREQFTYNVIFEFKDLYFSYNNTNDNEKKIYIDKDGNRYQDDGVKASNTNVEQFEGTNALENITDFLNDLRLTSDYFNYNFELNWNKLPGNIQGLILFVFNMSCILVILRIGGYK